MDITIPDFGIDDDDDADSAGPAGSPPTETAGPLGVPQQIVWGSLALELALAPHEFEGICATYRTTPEIVMAMLGKGTHPFVPTPVAAFKTALHEAKRKVDSLGPTAGYVLRAQTAAEHSLVRLFDIANNKAVPPQVALKAIELLNRYGRTDPLTEKRSNDGQAAPAVGVMVQFSLGPGLPVPAGLVISPKPTQQPE